MKAYRIAVALFVAALAMTSVRAALRADAVLLVNSQSTSYTDAQRYIRPYLDNFGVPYTVLDVATTPVTSAIGDYALIIVGHRQLDVSHLYLDATEEGYLSQAVQNGTGLVNFDNDLSSNNSTARYQFIQNVFGFGYAAPASVSGVTIPSDAASYYVTSRHAGGEAIATAPMTSAGITLPVTAHALATTSSPAAPFLVSATYLSGRAIQWANYDWMSTDVKGPMYGLDDLVWRSFVWAARKPFAMQGLPNILTMRVDDTVGSFWYVHTANQFGLKPWLGLFYQSISNADATDLSTLVHAGNATASVHAEYDDHWFYWDHYGAQNWPDVTMNSKFDAATAWHTAHDVPISKFVLAHYYEMGTNAFARLQGWGVEFVGLSQNPGDGFDSGRWIQERPYRLYEAPSYANRALPMYYADVLTVTDPNPPQTQRTFFNCLTEIRDDAGYEWYPDNDVAGTIGRGTRQVKRAFDSMALGTLFTHEQHIVPISPSNWSQELQGITANLAPYNPRFMTMDDACRYVRAVYKSDIASAVYDPATHNLNASFTGNADVATQFYAFTDRDGSIVETLVDVPAFTGSTQVSHQVAGALHHIVVSPANPFVPVGGSRQFTAQGFDVNDNPIIGLGVSWLASAGGSVSQSGVFTAGATPGDFTNSVAASNGSVTGYASVQVYAPVVDQFVIDPITGSIQAGSPFGIRMTAYDQYEQIFTSYAGPALLSDTTGTISPGSTGTFAAGVWTGNVTLGISATGATITATSGAGSGTSNTFNVSPAQSGSIAFGCPDDNHQTPVLPTTSNVAALNENDGQWTEFYYDDCRNYASVFAGVDEESHGLPLMDFYYVGIPNGQYHVTGKLYTSATTGRDMRYFYGFQAASPKAFHVDVLGGTGGCEQHANYDLGIVSVTNGRFDLYVQDADLLPTATSSYPFFGWAAIRLDCVNQTWYRDADGDGYGNPAMPGEACAAPAGYVANAADCNDSNPAVHPGAADTSCDGIDENCNGQLDESYFPVATACGIGACARTGVTSCVSSSVQDSCVAGSPTAEVCDGIDNDCNGVVDNGAGPIWYRDADGDGYGNLAVTTQACSVPAGYVANSGDCIDASSAVHPGAADTSCNGIDENCSGQADEGYAPVATSCGVGACARTGVTSCLGGSVQDSCVSGAPASEVCDGIDNDCNGGVDDGAGPMWYRDADGDGYGALAAATQACSVPAGYVANAEDCNDADPAIHPEVADTSCNGIDENCSGQADEGYASSATACGVGACSRTGATSCVSGTVQDSCVAGTPIPEVCDGVDDDCNGVVDNGVLITWYQDVDGDGYGALAAATQACSVPAGYVANAEDCNDADPAIHPAVADTNCNGIDENCSGQADEGYASSATACGIGACSRTGATSCVSGTVQDSCVAGTATPEVCDGVDDDCNGVVDNGVLITWYQDVDGDGYGALAAATQACSVPAGYVANAEDCNDADPAIHPAVADTNCNGIDENCSGQADEGYASSATACGIGACSRTGATSCVSGTVQDSCVAGTATPEVCDGVDNDCDGDLDNGVGPTWYRDTDGDGYGVPSPAVVACAQPAGYAPTADDCDDANPAVHPGAADANCNDIDENCNGQADDGYVPQATSCGLGACAAAGVTSCVAGTVQDSCVAGEPAPEVCDGLDNNCDGSVDNEVGPTWYRDTDGDGYGVPSPTVVACAQPAGYAPTADDCDDANPAVHPGAADTDCNGIDENCSGQADEGYAPAATACGVGACASTGITSCVSGVVLDSCVAGSPTPEICDGVDNDCDGHVDIGVGPTWYRDSDGDGYGDANVTILACALPAGYVDNATDCEDTNPNAHPGGDDSTCNGIDENCDGTADEGYVSVEAGCGVGACAATGMTSCVAGVVQSSCAPGTPTPEVCDGIDNNCDGGIDNGVGPIWFRDADGDGYGNPGGTEQACSTPVGYVANAEDCNDASQAVHPGAADANCDAVDDNCSGQADEGYAPVATGCGVGACAATGVTSCVAGVVHDSCVAGTPTPEVCDGIDNDCNVAVDNGVLITWFRDSDGDGHGVASDAVLACTQPFGYVTAVGDCNDADAQAFGAPGEVTSLTLVRQVNGVQLAWTGQAATAGPGTTYNLVTGVIAELRSDHGFTRAACLDSGLTTTAYDDTRSTPPASSVYYLARATNSCGSGTFGPASPTPDPRAALAAASPCP